MTTTTAASTAANITNIRAKSALLPLIAATTSGAMMPPMRPMAPAQPEPKARQRTG